MKPRAGLALTSVMVVLTLTTGMVEAVSFLVLGPVFTAVQTGNVILLGFAIAGEGGISASGPLVSLGGFAVGAVLGSRFESSVDARSHQWFPTALIGEAVLLGIAGLVAWAKDVEEKAGHLSGAHVAVIAMVAAAMGMRNVTTLRVRVPDLPTTLATRALTGFLGGLPLAFDTRIASGARNEGRRLASIGAVFAGSLLGAWMLHEHVHPAAVLGVPALLVLAVGIGWGLAPRARTSEPG